jgi:Transposase
MTVTIVETRVQARAQARAITGGVDTHADVHVAAALDPLGGLLGVQEFPANPAGYARLVEWLGGFGTVCLVGIEGTGSYGAGLARHIAAAGIRVVEVDRSDRQDRRRRGKSDPLDAVSAARAAQSGRAAGAPKGRDGQVEAIRALMVAKRTARSERIQTINQARSLIVTGPDDLRARFAGHCADDLVAELASLRPRPGSMIRYLVTGKPDAAQAVKPPSRSVALVRPSCCSVAAARLDWYPSWHTRMRCTSRLKMAGCRHWEEGSQRHSSELRGSTMAPGISPSARRCSSPRMSTSSEPFCCAWKASAGEGLCGSIALAWISRSSMVLAVR